MQEIKPLITSPTMLGASREIQCFLQIRTFGDGQDGIFDRDRRKQELALD
jgi:hypothetical protein